MIEQYKINESTLRELSDQKKRINELRKVVNYLELEKMKRDCFINAVLSHKNSTGLQTTSKIIEQVFGDESMAVNLNV